LVAIRCDRASHGGNVLGASEYFPNHDLGEATAASEAEAAGRIVRGISLADMVHEVITDATPQRPACLPLHPVPG